MAQPHGEHQQQSYDPELRNMQRHEPAPMQTGQPSGQVPVGLAMKQRHPVTVWLLWPVITLGIYHFVWYYKIHKDMAEFDPRRSVPVAGPMLVLLLLGWLFVPAMISYYNCGNRIRQAQRAAGLQPSCSSAIGMLLMLVFGVGILYYQIELNKIADAYGVPEGEQVQLRS